MVRKIIRDYDLFGNEIFYDDDDYIFEISKYNYDRDLKNNFISGIVVGATGSSLFFLLIGILDYVGIL